MTSNHDDRSRGGGGLLLGAGAVLLVVLCCALPVLIAGGVLASIGGLLIGNPWVIGVGIALVLLVALTVARRRTRRGFTDSDCCPPTDSTHHADTEDEQKR
ncbi:hypothetical protein ACI3KT_04125 [Microbacterium sp. ZW T6_19]|uniref:hypothetical protein n=1 Tax=Microbacterium TaxID=33882 RepID=UPI001D1EE901|nr:hypothetical protein [Microbacterium oxydans]CAH0123515.1 hypothetical protein SRABI76_00033 [Microbacterium oxydans]